MDSSSALTIRLLMNRKEVETIIAKKKFIIKQIKKRSETLGVTLGFSDEEHFPVRIVSIVGTQRSIAMCIEIMCDIWEAGESLSHKLILLMFSDQCWPIKGLRGKKQADIQNRSGAKLVISDECRPNSDEKDVIVSGSKHDVAYCIYLTCGVVLECPRGSASRPFEVYFPFAKPLFVPPGLLKIWILLTDKEYGCITGQGNNEIGISNRFKEEYGESLFHISLEKSSDKKIIRFAGTPDTIVNFVDFICLKMRQDLEISTPPAIRVILSKKKIELLQIKNFPVAPPEIGDLSQNSFAIVTVSGPSDFISSCVYHICGITLQTDQEMRKTVFCHGISSSIFKLVRNEK